IGAVVGAVLAAATGAFAASSSAGPMLTLNAGQSMSVNCAGQKTSINWAQSGGANGVVSCAGLPISTTLPTLPTTRTAVAPTTTPVAPSTTTTVPSTTTTTVAPTTTTVPTTGGSSACGLSQAAFCATFPTATANPASSRSGQLDGTLWGTSV